MGITNEILLAVLCISLLYVAILILRLHSWRSGIEKMLLKEFTAPTEPLLNPSREMEIERRAAISIKDRLEQALKEEPVHKPSFTKLQQILQDFISERTTVPLLSEILRTHPKEEL